MVRLNWIDSIQLLSNASQVRRVVWNYDPVVIKFDRATQRSVEPQDRVLIPTSLYRFSVGSRPATNRSFPSRVFRSPQSAVIQIANNAVHFNDHESTDRRRELWTTFARFRQRSTADVPRLPIHGSPNRSYNFVPTSWPARTSKITNRIPQRRLLNVLPPFLPLVEGEKCIAANYKGRSITGAT